VTLPAALACLLAAGAAAWGYLADSAAAFFGGLALLAPALALLSLRLRRRGGSRAVLVLNTLCLLALALAALEAFARAFPEPPLEGDFESVYAYADARRSPERFARWWARYVDEWVRSRERFMRDDPRGVNPFLPRPGAEGRFFDAGVRINRLGFRGPEIELAKGDRYRIVALGESTTFGATIRADDRPWPEMLEERLANLPGCEARVQVVNAGIPGFTIANNNARLQHEILPLAPDMILSYHGYNGFPYLMGELPSLSVEVAPRTPERASRLLRRAETAVRLWWFRRRFEAARIDVSDVSVPELHATRYAREYRQLAEFAAYHGIRLVLCTFNLAANAHTPEEVVRFYELAFPDVRMRVFTNQLHTRLVRSVADAFDLTLVDTSRGLDGAYADAFIDIMHFNQTGRQRFVDNVAGALEDVLRAEPRMRCAREPAGAEGS
jgi:lysophospholipase L1-like esterase